MSANFCFDSDKHRLLFLCYSYKGKQKGLILPIKAFILRERPIRIMRIWENSSQEYLFKKIQPGFSFVHMMQNVLMSQNKLFRSDVNEICDLSKLCNYYVHLDFFTFLKQNTTY